MATLAITIDLPPTGELETSGNGSSPTQAQQDEEMKARQNFIDLVSPYLESLPERPPHRAWQCLARRAAGPGCPGQELNHYLLLITIDITYGGIDQDLAALLPPGAQVSVVGVVDLEDWPASAGGQSPR